MLRGLHHVAVICGDYAVSKAFYVETLGLRVLDEHYRDERQSWKLDLALPDGGQVELFSFPDAPARPSWPEARGLRHLAFAVDDIDAACARLTARGVVLEPVRVDPYTGQRFVFFADPDGLPLELYEVAAPAPARGETARPAQPGVLRCRRCAAAHAAGRRRTARQLTQNATRNTDSGPTGTMPVGLIWRWLW